jgi:hypothetical protein
VIVAVLASVSTEDFNPGPFIFGFALVVSLLVGRASRAMRRAGSGGITGARTRWGRALAHVSFYAGWTGTAVAVLVFVAGAWVGITAKSPYEQRLSDARAMCRRLAATVSGLETGEQRDAYIHECVTIEVD